MRAILIQRINFLWFVTLGITALAAGIVVYLLLLESALGAFRITGSATETVGERHRPTIGILYSANSKAAFGQLFPGEGSALYDAMYASWDTVLTTLPAEDTLQLVDGDLDRIFAGTPTADPLLSADNHDILILPSAISMDSLAWSQVASFLENGGSLLISWSGGIYDQNLRWTGWGKFSDVLGITFSSYVEAGNGDYRVSTDTLSESAPTGVYVPGRDYERLAEERRSRLNARETAQLLRTQERASSIELPQLRDYVWYDTLGIEYPLTDFITISTESDVSADISAASGTVISYYNWMGQITDEHAPFPRMAGSTRRFTLQGNTALTAGIPGGYRAKVQVYDPGVVVRITDPERVHSAGFWYDFATSGPAERNLLTPESGLAYGRYGKGRFVYMGFNPDALGASAGDPEDEAVWTRLYGNVMDYLGRRPLVWTHDWPAGHAAAALITSNVSESTQHIDQLVRFVDATSLPLTVFASENAVRQNPDALIRLSTTGEIGALDISAKPLTGSLEDRRHRVGRIRQVLGDQLGVPIYGYRSVARGTPGNTTKDALAREGYQYFLPDSVGRRTTPKIMGEPFESLTRVGVTAHELAHAQTLDSDSTAQSVGSILLSDAYRVLEEGGVYRLSLSDEHFASTESVQVLEDVVDRLRLEQIWFATGSEIARWWRLRNGLNVAVEQRSRSRLFIRLSNDNGDTADEATVSIALAEPVSDVVIRPELINILKTTADEIDIPPYEILHDGTVLELQIRQLKPQQYRIFHVDLIHEDFYAQWESDD